MKAIILISSIFYILGLKIGNKIELVKQNKATEKVIIQKAETTKPADCCKYTDELAIKSNNDTIQGGISYSDALLKSKEL